MSKVLVTGATGFIGRQTLDKLSEEYEHVFAVYRNSKLIGNWKNVTWHKADLLSEEQINQLIGKISATHLLHLAWYAEHGKYGQSELNIDWLSSSLHLIRRFRESGGRRVVSAGTCFEYDLNYGFLSEKITPLKPELIYGVSKKNLFEMLSSYSDLTGLSSAWGRVFYLYGPHEYSGRLVASVIRSLLRNQPAETSSGEQLKDFLHVSDVAEAFVKLLHSNAEGAVNIGSGNAVSVKDIVLKIGELTGKKKLVKIGALSSRKNEKPLIMADNRRLKREAGWTPQFTLEEGLKHTIQWWSDSLGKGN